MLRTIRRAVVTLFVLFAGLYSVILLLYWLGRGIVGERLFVISLLNSLMPVLALPALIALPLLLLARRWRLAAIASVTVAALAVLYGPRFIPRAYTASDERTLRVMTFNIQSRTSGFEPTIAAIRAANPHIVVLQEFRNQAAEALTPALDDLYPYSLLDPTGNYARGMGLYSKFPLRDGVYFDSIALGGQRVTVEQAQGRAITLYNVHPVPPQWWSFTFNTDQRTREISVLLDDLAAQPDDVPVIMAGDFNMTDLSDDYTRVMKMGMIDGYAQVGDGLGPTWPDSRRYFPFPVPFLPAIRIDYVFYSGGWADAESAYVGGENGGSDHFPVVVTLRVRG